MVDRLPAIALDGLGLVVDGHTIVRPATLELPLRGRTVILGPNGAGKTTLLQLIHQMTPGSTGSVAVREGSADGRAVRDGELGLVLQRPVMLSRSVEANVHHALAIRKVALAQRAARVRDALDKMGLGDFSARAARRLSGGEQQRLAIARVIAASPDCLLLDEPTAHLDPGSAAAVERLLISLSATGLGLVMSTHDLGQARRMAEQVVFMHRGEVVEYAPAREFFEAPATVVARRFLAGDLLD